MGERAHPARGADPLRAGACARSDKDRARQLSRASSPGSSAQADQPKREALMAIAAKTYGVAIIGTGRISGAHARAAQSVENAKLIAAAETDEERGKAFAEKWGVE